MNLIKPLILPLLLSAALYAPQATSLENDNEQPIYIDSDTASYDEQNEVSIYTGNVIYTQGSLVIHSDKMTFHLKDGEITKVVAVGNPARLKQSPGAGKEDIKGKALTGEYYPATSKLHLIKNAEVSQGGKKTQSDLIIYDTRYSVLTAGDKSSGAKRVRSVFQPSAKK